MKKRTNRANRTVMSAFLAGVMAVTSFVTCMGGMPIGVSADSNKGSTLLYGPSTEILMHLSL